MGPEYLKIFSDGEPFREGCSTATQNPFFGHKMPTLKLSLIVRCLAAEAVPGQLGLRANTQRGLCVLAVARVLEVHNHCSRCLGMQFMAYPYVCASEDSFVV